MPDAVGAREFGMSGLLYRHSLTSLKGWLEPARSILVLHEPGFVSPGEHAARAAARLPRVVEYLHRLLTFGRRPATSLSTPQVGHKGV